MVRKNIHMSNVSNIFEIASSTKKTTKLLSITWVTGSAGTILSRNWNQNLSIRWEKMKINSSCTSPINCSSFFNKSPINKFNQVCCTILPMITVSASIWKVSRVFSWLVYIKYKKEHRKNQENFKMTKGLESNWHLPWKQSSINSKKITTGSKEKAKNYNRSKEKIFNFQTKFTKV